MKHEKLTKRNDQLSALSLIRRSQAQRGEDFCPCAPKIFDILATMPSRLVEAVVSVDGNRFVRLTRDGNAVVDFYEGNIH